MSQDQIILLCFKIIEIGGLVTITAFICCYSRWARWWKNPIGRTLVAKDIALILVFIPSVLSIFLRFNRLTSHIAAWSDIAMIGSISPVMIWRTAVFWKIHKAGKLARLTGDKDP